MFYLHYFIFILLNFTNVYISNLQFDSYCFSSVFQQYILHTDINPPHRHVNTHTHKHTHTNTFTPPAWKQSPSNPSPPQTHRRTKNQEQGANTTIGNP